LIPYVICESGEGPNDRLSDRAFHVDEVRASNRRLDAEWYLETQLYPPVLRICSPVQGFSSAQLAEAMGLHHHVDDHAAGAAHDTLDFTNAPEKDDFANVFRSVVLEDCFPLAFPLQVRCESCSIMTPILPHRVVEEQLHSMKTEGPRNVTSRRFSPYVCTSCRKPQPIPYVANCLTTFVHRHLREFYRKGGGEGEVRQLRQQVTYFRALFDVPHMPGCSPELLMAHREFALRCVDAKGTERTQWEVDTAAALLQARRERNGEGRNNSSSGHDDPVATLAELNDEDLDAAAQGVNPLLNIASLVYDRVAHMRLDNVRILPPPPRRWF
jgi:DNA polymerase alpha subunit A